MPLPAPLPSWEVFGLSTPARCTRRSFPHWSIAKARYVQAPHLHQLDAFYGVAFERIVM